MPTSQKQAKTIAIMVTSSLWKKWHVKATSKLTLCNLEIPTMAIQVQNQGQYITPLCYECANQYRILQKNK